MAVIIPPERNLAKCISVHCIENVSLESIEMNFDMQVLPWNKKLFPTIVLDKFFIMSTEFDKAISDWGYDSADHKNEMFFFSWDLLNGQK